MDRIKVLIVEDSAVMRQILTEILSQDPEIEVLGTAPDVNIARQKIKALNPDVITLDVELPGMDGISFLEKIMRLRPTPVVMISGYTQNNSEAAIRALEIGAVDVIGKSNVNLDTSLSDKSNEITRKVKEASRAKFSAIQSPPSNQPAEHKKLASSRSLALNKVICIGASAGGVEAMRYLVSTLPSQCPPILYAQHMPQEFTARFAERLNETSALVVQEATDGEKIKRGHIYMAPGDRHLALDTMNGDYICRVNREEKMNRHRPSVDYLFNSAAAVAGKKGIGVILTGMGRDGAEGLLAMRKAGAITIGQDEASSLIYGMPRMAAEIGAVQQQVPLRKIGEEIITACSRRGNSVSGISLKTGR